MSVESLDKLAGYLEERSHINQVIREIESCQATEKSSGVYSMELRARKKQLRMDWLAIERKIEALIF